MPNIVGYNKITHVVIEANRFISASPRLLEGRWQNPSPNASKPIKPMVQMKVGEFYLGLQLIE